MSKDRSPWIELHGSVATHRKTWALAAALGVERVQALGHICCLWLWAIEQAQDGDLSSFPAKAICEAAGWQKRPAVLLAALVASGYVDENMQIHEWDEYVGRLMDKRETDRKRQAEKRAKERGQSGERPMDSPRDVAGHRLPSTAPSTVNLTAKDEIPPNPPQAGGNARAMRARAGSKRKRDVIALRSEQTTEDRYLGSYAEKLA